MNRWAAWLADTPASLQRAIAGHQRISLPRRHDAATRLARLREALCHARTVQVTYFSLSPELRAAAQELRHQPRGLSAAELTARYGELRAPAAILADRRPRSVAEQLVLLGWLVPRPAAPHHPPRYLLPPELRAWLPRPLDLPAEPPAPGPRTPGPVPLALRLLGATLLACAEAPLPLRQDGAPSAAALRLLLPRLAPYAGPAVAAAARLLIPLLADLGLISTYNRVAALLPAARPFLDLPAHEQLARLREAWVGAPRADAWLLPLLRSQRGIFWPTLRRRLLAWAEALPAGRPLEPDASYDALAAALGPLADAFTHWQSRPSRARWERSPWNRRRSAAIWQAALRGPLAWLGLVAWADDGEGCALPATPGPTPPPWRYAGPGEFCVPHLALCRDVRLLPAFATFESADSTGLVYRLDRRRMAQARARGEPLGALAALLVEKAGPAPEGWWGEAPQPTPTIRLIGGVVAVADEPAQLEQAARRRSVRRYLAAQLAPGVALVAPERAGSLARTLQRANLEVREAGEYGPPPAPLSPAECAAMLELIDFYRRNGPAAAPADLAQLEDRLRAALPPARRLAAAAYDPAAPLDAPAPDSAPVAISSLLPAVRKAMRSRRTLTIRYAGADGPPSERSIRPLRLERHAEHWYLYAYCLARQAERCFRLDRVVALTDGG